MKLHIYRSFSLLRRSSSSFASSCLLRRHFLNRNSWLKGLSSSEYGLPVPQVCNCALELQYNWGMGRAGEMKGTAGVGREAPGDTHSVPRAVVASSLRQTESAKTL